MKLHNASNSRCNCLLNFIIMFITDFSLLGWTLMNSWCISPIPFRSSDGGVVCGGCRKNSFEETQVRCTHCTSEDADYQLLGIFTSLVSDRWLITFVGRIAFPAEQCAFNSYIHITPQSICSRIGRSDSCRVLYWTWFHNYCDLTENNQYHRNQGETPFQLGRPRKHYWLRREIKDQTELTLICTAYPYQELCIPLANYRII